MASFMFHTDVGLTTPLAGTFDFAQSVDGSSGPRSPSCISAPPPLARRCGQRAILASIPWCLRWWTVRLAEARATDVTLSLEPTFAGRTAGASLSLGVQINSGVSNAVPIYVRVQDSTGTIGVNTDLSLVMTLAEEA